MVFIIAARDAVNNYLDDEKNRNKYLSPTEMNCLGMYKYGILLSQYEFDHIMFPFEYRESFAQVLVQISNGETERGCANYCG